jgi:hypothetical protein
MMSLDEIGKAIETGHAASFLDDEEPSFGGPQGLQSAVEEHAPIALEIEV